MRIVLINPAMDVKAGFGEFAGIMEAMPCIGIASLAASVKKAGHDVLCIDNFALNWTHQKLLEKIDEFRADLVGQSCLTPTAMEAFGFNRLLREKRPGIKTVLGNVHATVFADEILQKGQADFVLEGECEHSLPALLDAVANASGMERIPGLHFSRGGGEIAYAGPPERIDDLDALPRPDWSSLPWKQYTFLPFVTVATPVMAIMGSRGCPYHCSFCALGYQGRYRVRRAEGIAEEMEILATDFGARHIGFVDPIFPLKKDHLFELCERIRKRGIHKRATWTSETRVDSVDKEMMAQMKSAGVRRILFGVESASDRLLANINKGFTVDQVRRCIGWAKEAGLETVCFFILGLPGETSEETRATARFPIELDVDFAKFATLVPLPGSSLFEDLVTSGRLSSQDWTKFTTFRPSPDDLPYVPEGMTGGELLDMQKSANLNFYFRPRIIFRHLFKIRTIRFRRMFSGFAIWLRWRLRGISDSVFLFLKK